MRCANCNIVIRWRPTIKDGKPYCCTGCAQGGPCDCDYSRLPLWGDGHAIVVRYSQNLTITHFPGAAPATDERPGTASRQTVKIDTQEDFYE